MWAFQGRVPSIVAYHSVDLPAPVKHWFWCQGQDSNLRSPSGQRFYRPSVLATHPPWPDTALARTGSYRLEVERRANGSTPYIPFPVLPFRSDGARGGIRTPSLPIT